MDKIDGRKNNGGNKNAGRKPKNEGRVTKSLNLLPETVERIIEESKRLGISQASVVDGWAKGNNN